MKALGLLALLLAAWFLLRRKGQAASLPGTAAPDLPQAPPSPDVASLPAIAVGNDALDNIAQAIFYQEGPGLRDANNNPGNLRSIGGSFKSFADIGDGWDALNNYITSHAAAHPDWDFYDFFNYYLRGSTTAPSVDAQGNSDSYAEQVANYAGFDPTQTVSSALWGS